MKTVCIFFAMSFLREGLACYVLLVGDIFLGYLLVRLNWHDGLVRHKRHNRRSWPRGEDLLVHSRWRGRSLILLYPGY